MLHPVLQKPLALSIALCLGLSGCQVFDKSETWETVMQVRPGQSVRDPDPSHAYASRLHAALASRGIEHKVITYQYRYTTRLREEAVGTRTAVIYRDASSGAHQWWLKDDRLNKPVWLPNGELNRQVSFYLRRKAEVIEEKNYPAKGGSSKAMLVFAKPSQSLRPAERAIVKVAPVKKAPAPVVVKKPEPTPKPVVIKVKPAPVRIVARPAPAPTPKVRQPEPASFFKMAPAKDTTKPVAKQQPAPKIAAKKKPIAKLKPRAATKPRVVAVATKPVPVAAKPAPTVKPTLVAAKPAPVAKAAPVAVKTAPAPKPAPIAQEADVLTPIASRSTSTWNPPNVLDRAQQPPETAPRDRHLEKSFRAKHGTEYNVFSPSDRRKMMELQESESSVGL